MPLWQILTSVAAFVVVAIGAAIGVRAQKNSTAFETLKKDRDALNGMLGTTEKRAESAEKDLSIVTTEHKQLIQVDVTKMVDGWTRFEASVVSGENKRLREALSLCTCDAVGPVRHLLLERKS